MLNKNVRAALRATAAAIALPFFVGAVALQGFVVGPLTKDYAVIPNFLCRGLRSLLGYKVEFNKASAPVETNRQAWYVSNHLSIADFLVMGSVVKATFSGKGEVAQWPLISQMARAVNYIGFRRKREFNGESRAKLIENFNKGYNALTFPEGTTTDGKRVGLFRGALFTILFGEKGEMEKKPGVLRRALNLATGKKPAPVMQEFALQKDIVVQPIASRVLSVDGESALGNDRVRGLYAMYDENNTVRRLWKRLQLRETVLELTAFPPLNPGDFANQNDLMNAAAKQIVTVVNPGQATFEKAAIPGQKPQVRA